MQTVPSTRYATSLGWDQEQRDLKSIVNFQIISTSTHELQEYENKGETTEMDKTLSTVQCQLEEVSLRKSTL